MAESCAVVGCEAEATVVADVPAYPLNWEHPVCEHHLKALESPHTKLDYRDDDTVAVVED
jgi:hypothetical protein